MSAERPPYLDSSAIVKLVVADSETAALRRFLRRRRPLVSSALARPEVVRAVLPLGDVAVRRAEKVLGRISLVRINDRLLTAAGTLEPPEVRSLDAIHLASAGRLGDSLHRFVTYDHRMAEVARGAGWTVVAPD